MHTGADASESPPLLAMMDDERAAQTIGGRAMAVDYDGRVIMAGKYKNMPENFDHTRFAVYPRCRQEPPMPNPFLPVAAAVAALFDANSASISAKE